MFEFLEGEVEAHEPGWLVLRVGGYGWRVAVSARDAGGFPVGSQARLRVHLIVGENAFSLFGFANDSGRSLFRRLISVNGVGPGTAMSLLSALSGEELAAAVVDGNVTRLTAVKGIGRKTADRLVVELRDHLAALVPGPGSETPGTLQTGGEDLVRVLAGLGCSPREAERRAEAARRELGADAPFQELLRTALHLAPA